MKESLVTLETAKLAKEKGFDPYTWDFYWQGELNSGVLDDGMIQYNSDSDYAEKFVFAAPTQSILQKWLRDEHKVFVQIEVDQTYEPKFCFGLWWYCGDGEWEGGTDRSDLYYTYEEALEAGLQEALKLVTSQTL